MCKEASKRQLGHSLLETLASIAVGSLLLVLVVRLIDAPSQYLPSLVSRVNHLYTVTTAAKLLLRAYRSADNIQLLNKPNAATHRIKKYGVGRYQGGQILVADSVWYIGKNADKQLGLYRFKNKYRRQVASISQFYFNAKAQTLTLSSGGKSYMLSIRK